MIVKFHRYSYILCKIFILKVNLQIYIENVKYHIYSYIYIFNITGTNVYMYACKPVKYHRYICL